MNSEYKNLRFRRQFLVTQETCLSLQDWPCIKFDIWNIYAHPELEVNIKSNDNIQLALIGFILNPHQPEQSNDEIITNLLHQIQTIDDVAECLFTLGGRFVLLINLSGKMYVFNDPCGLRSVFYTYDESKFYCGSHASILSLAVPLNKGSKYKAFMNSSYKAQWVEYWLPANCSPYENIFHLTPNHFLHVDRQEQYRYWPSHALKQIELTEGVEKAASLLAKLLKASSHRFDFALPLTAGWDSRTILAGCKPFIENIFFYTLQYRTLNEESPDIHISKKILESIGCTHHLIECSHEPEALFSQIYFENVSFAHEDWNKIAYGMFLTYPQDRVCIKGNCAEIGRSVYDPMGKQPPVNNAEQMVELVPGWEELDFVRDRIYNWFEEATQATRSANIYILDLFYWEHKMGSWQAQSQLEWDIVQEAFSPFNHRELSEIMLSIAPKYRRKGNKNILFREIIKNLWPQLMEQPINPHKKKDLIYYYKRILKRLGLFQKSW